jgi:phosphate:Na+ symporter
LDHLAVLLGGLGLFLVGIQDLTGNLKTLAGPRLRRILGGATRSKPATAGVGLLLGLLTQSTNVAATIVASLATARALTLPAGIGLLAWTNPGSAALVLLASLDLRLAVLWLLGLVGLFTALRLDAAGWLRSASGAMVGLGLIFLGLDLIKDAASSEAGRQLTAWLFANFGAGIAGAALTGLVGGLLVQSAATLGILALALLEAGLLGRAEAIALVIGASAGSGLALLWPMRVLAGEARRLLLFQALARLAAALLLAAAFLAEAASGLPGPRTLVQALSPSGEAEIGLVFLLLQSLPPLLLAPHADRLAGRLRALLPDSATEALARPRFIYARALDDPPTALALVTEEQRALMARLPSLLDGPRGAAPPDAPSRLALLAAAVAVETATRDFTAELLGRGAGRATVADAIARQQELATLGALRETLGEFGEAMAAAIRDPTLAPLVGRLAEALHLLLLQLAELPAGTPEDHATLLLLADDRSEMMEALRRRTAAGEASLGAEGHALLFRVTGLFERAVWLVRRLALASAPGQPGSGGP